MAGAVDGGMEWVADRRSVRSEDRGRDTRIGEKPRGWEDRGALFKSNGA